MPVNKADTKHITEGRFEEVSQQRATYGDTNDAVTKQTFVRMVVLDVISDPFVIDDTKLSHMQHALGVTNVAYARHAPRNSIIARPVMRAGAGAHEKVMVLYPFFPPHLSMPAKAGEHVWAIFENPNATVNEIGYWMCRVVQPHFVEDVNYTHADRQGDPSFSPSLSEVFGGSGSPVYEYRNGVVDKSDGSRYTIGGTCSLLGDETAYESLLTNTDAAALTMREPVPRYRKRPADIALEGSNNTLISLGTDRVGPVASYAADDSRGNVPRPVPEDVFAAGAGSIDIVAGRGQTPATAGTTAQALSLSGVQIGTELGKSQRELVPAEGDPDLVNDRSRVLVAQRTRPDTNFGISNVVSSHASAKAVEDGDGSGAVVVKSDKVRIVARQDVVIMVLGADQRDNNGNVKDPGSLDAGACASIILRSNGDIVFTPSRTGVIKLGGDDASLAVLCGRAVTGAGDGAGVVTAAPLVDSMGGTEGSGGPSGQFATKVLLR